MCLTVHVAAEPADEEAAAAEEQEEDYDMEGLLGEEAVKADSKLKQKEPSKRFKSKLHHYQKQVPHQTKLLCSNSVSANRLDFSLSPWHVTLCRCQSVCPFHCVGFTVCGVGAALDG